MSFKMLTENTDFRLLSESIVFEDGGELEKCVSIEITDDIILEDTESFLVEITTNNTRGVILNPNKTTVHIVGVDGE